MICLGCYFLSTFHFHGMRWIPDWKGCKFSRVVETVGFDEIFKEFNKWCNMYHMCTLKMFIPSLAWKDLFNYLERPSINKYHHETKFKTYRSQYRHMRFSR